MSYIYSEHRHFTFTAEGQAALCEALLAARAASTVNGFITHEQIASAFYVPGSWAKLAVIDRLVELHYIVPISRDGARQDYVYRWTGKR